MALPCGESTFRPLAWLTLICETHVSEWLYMIPFLVDPRGRWLWRIFL